MSDKLYSRRALLRLAVGTMGAGILAACGAGNKIGSSTPTSVTASTAASIPTSSSSSVPVRNASPTSVSGNVPSPGMSATTSSGTATASGMIPSPAPGVPPAYLKLPPLHKSVKQVPGKGGPLNTVNTFEVSYSPPVKPLSQNKYWQELNKRLGVNLKVQLAPADSYVDKFATVIASGNIPELTWLWDQQGPTVQAVQQGAFTDLTPYLTGDALKEFPNLALIPSKIWQNAMFEGKSYGVPRPRFMAGDTLMWRQDWAQKVGYGEIRNGNDFEKCVIAMTKADPDGDKKSNTWGLSAWQGANYSDQFIFYMFRVANQWRVSQNGKFTYYAETPEYKQAIEYARKLGQAGVYYPSTGTQVHQNCVNGFVSGKFGGYIDSLNSLPAQAGGNLRLEAKQVDPNANVIGLVPPGHDGGKAITWNDRAFFGYTGIPSKVGKDQQTVKELLRILDYFAAPFGSEEYIFVNYGLKGWDYKPGPDGGPVLTDTGQVEIGDLPRGLANATYPLYYPQEPSDAVFMQKLIEDMLAIGIDDPSAGLYSPTSASKSAALAKKQSDMETGVISGREAVSAIDEFLTYWHQNGGDQIRKEYEQAYQKVQHQ